MALDCQAGGIGEGGSLEVAVGCRGAGGGCLWAALGCQAGGSCLGAVGGGLEWAGGWLEAALGCRAGGIGGGGEGALLRGEKDGLKCNQETLKI